MTEVRDPIAANRGAHCLPLGAALDATETASSPVQGGDGSRSITTERGAAYKPSLMRSPGAARLMPRGCAGCAAPASLSQQPGRQSAPRSFSSRGVQAPHRNGGCAGSLPGSSDSDAKTKEIAAA